MYGFKERMNCLKEKWKKLKSNEKFLYVQRSRLDKQKAMLEVRENLVKQVQVEKGMLVPKKSVKPIVTKTAPLKEVTAEIPETLVLIDNKE